MAGQMVLHLRIMEERSTKSLDCTEAKKTARKKKTEGRSYGVL